MDDHEILLELNKVFAGVLDDPALVLRRDTTADDVEGWDSLSHIQLVVAVEKHFGIRFLSAEIQSWRTVGDMADAVAAGLEDRGRR